MRSRPKVFLINACRGPVTTTTTTTTTPLQKDGFVVVQETACYEPSTKDVMVIYSTAPTEASFRLVRTCVCFYFRRSVRREIKELLGLLLIFLLFLRPSVGTTRGQGAIRAVVDLVLVLTSIGRYDERSKSYWGCC